MKKFDRNNIWKLIFIIISFLMLITPLCHINKDKRSHAENRSLSSYIPIYNVKKRTINFNYGKDFEAFLKDRFFGRLFLIHSNSSLKYFLSGRFLNINNVMVDKNLKFLYENTEKEEYSAKTQIQIVKELNLFNEYCKKNNIKLYMVILPHKEILYKPKLFKINKLEQFQQTINNISRHSNVNIICPLHDLIRAQRKNIPMFYSTDTHATIDASYISYISLMNEIIKDFPNIKIAQPSDFEYYYEKKVKSDEWGNFEQGDSCRLAGFPDNICNIFLKNDYRYYRHKNNKKLSMERTDIKKLNKKAFYYPDGSNLKLLLFGDSFSENLMDIIPYSFKHLARIRINGVRGINRLEYYKLMKFYEKEINEFKPDIIVIYINYRSSLGKLKDINNLN